MTDEDQTLEKTYREYVEAFVSLEPSAVLPFYSAPCMMISSRRVQLLASEKEIEANFARTMAGLKKASYDRTEIVDLTVSRKGHRVAIITAGLARFSVDNEKLGSRGGIYRFTYTLHKAKDHWQVVSVISHDPDFP